MPSHQQNIIKYFLLKLSFPDNFANILLIQQDTWSVQPFTQLVTGTMSYTFLVYTMGNEENTPTIIPSKWYKLSETHVQGTSG
jgi:hypothetical protein